MYFTHFLLGFFAKILTGLDDLATQIPIVSSITRTRNGKILYCAGILCSVIVAIAVARMIADFLVRIWFYKYIIVILLVLLAIVVYFDLFGADPNKLKKKVVQKVSMQRATKLFVLGFITSFATLVDDLIVYTSLFTAEAQFKAIAAIGIFTAALLEVALIVFFSSALSKVSFKKEIAVGALLTIAGFYLFGVL